MNFIAQLSALPSKIISFFMAIMMIFSMSFGFGGSMKPFESKTIEDELIDIPTMDIANEDESPYVIVRGANASEPEKTAALKLQDYLAQISGATLPIVDDSSAATDFEFIIGRTSRESAGDYVVDRAALGDDGFIIKTVGNSIVIAGGEKRGTLYGVFDFLEKFCGCLWLSSEVRVIPQQEILAVPLEIDETEVPAYSFRCPTIIASMTSVDVDYALANRVNGLAYSVAAEEYGGYISYAPGHSAELIVPASVYYDSNPEYFALQKDGTYDRNNPCLTNPEVTRLYIEYGLNQLRANPSLESFHMGLNDSSVTCYCEQCQKIYEQEGAVSGTLIHLLNKVAEAMNLENPDNNTKIVTFAYASTVDAPKCKVDDKILIYYCPILMCYSHPLVECTGSRNIDSVSQLKAWGEVANNIMIFEYPMTYSEYGLPYPIWAALQPNIQFYYENNAIGLFNCSNAYSDGNFFVFNNYIYAKLLWDPYLDLEQVMRDFLENYYGEGWQYIREYIRFLSEEATGKTFMGVQTHSYCMNSANSPGLLVMNRAQVSYVDKLWEDALAATDIDWQITNLRRSQLSWRTWKADNFIGEFARVKIPSTWEAASKQLFADINELGIIHHSETGEYVSAEEFEKLDLYVLPPNYWSWRKLGKENQGVAENLWDIVSGWLSE